MNRMLCTIIIFFIVTLNGCSVNTKAVMVEGNKHYQPTNNTQILTQYPERPYKQIAILESRGWDRNVSYPALLEDMRQKGMRLGADAIIPVQEKNDQTPQGFMYNPWLGGYHTLGGNSIPILRGVAIKYQ